MKRTIQRKGSIDLSRLDKGVTYIFHLRNGKKVKTQLCPDWDGQIYPFRLEVNAGIYKANGSFHFTKTESSLDIVKVKLVKEKSE